MKEIFDGPLKGKHLNIFKGMANSAAVLDAYLGLAGAVGKSGLSAAEREAIQLAIGQQNNCDYCLAAHTKIGIASGLTSDQTVEVRRGKPSDPKLAALTRFALALHEKRGHVSDDDLKSFKAGGYTDGHIGEVVAVYALAVFTNYFNHVNDTAIDFPAPPAI